MSGRAQGAAPGPGEAPLATGGAMTTTTTTTQAGSKGERKSVVTVSSEVVTGERRIARFRGRAMVLEQEPYPHYVPMHRDTFETLAYPILGGVSRSRISDVFAYIGKTAEDLTPHEDLVLFGTEARSAFSHSDAVTSVWDMRSLETLTDASPAQAVWRSPYGRLPIQRETDGSRRRLPFIMSLAGNDVGLYDDIMQSLAPLVMRQKPDGVIWWIGDGANGKSTLMDAVYRIFPGQLSSITVKRLVDGRDTPSLNGTLANVVKESSEGRIEDTEIYKSIGTHENFRVHKFHSQDDMEIRGNLHHIFSGNSVPTFNDKGYSARRRTFIIPFTQRFESDPGFEARTFTPEFFGQLISEMCYYALQIRRQNYRYKWSAVTLAAKGEYDTDANNAEEYAKHIINEGVVAFESFNPLKNDYENWCADEGYVPLGITNLRRALTAMTFERVSFRDASGVRKIYRLRGVDEVNLQQLGMGRPGLYTIPGFTPEQPASPTLPEFGEDEVEPQPEKTILNGRW